MLLMLIALCGKPSCGKSTFFKAATLAEVDIAPYPFTTLKSCEGVGFVRIDCVDKESNVKCNPKHGFCLDGSRFVPVRLMDVPGLIKGSHKGAGMGNQFLDDLRQAHAFIHVVDVSGSINESGEPVEAGSYDPTNDIRFLEEELDMWYLGILTKGWDKFARQVSQEKGEIDKAIAKQLSGLGVSEEMVKQGIKQLNVEKPNEWTQAELKGLATFLRRKTKPMIIACNKIDVSCAAENYEKLKKEFPDLLLIPCSAESELALREAAKHELIKYVPGKSKFEIVEEKEGELSDKQKKALEFIQNNVLNKFGNTGVQQVLDKAVFELLKYKAVFPVPAADLKDKDGNILPDCFLLPEDATPLDLAFAIHTDIGKSYIKAVDIKKKIPIAKDHILKHRDIIEIMSGK